jgi:hypothetical protein
VIEYETPVDALLMPATKPTSAKIRVRAARIEAGDLCNPEDGRADKPRWRARLQRLGLGRAR